MRLNILLGLVILVVSQASIADEAINTTETDEISVEKLLCPDADIWGKKMITGICWSCLFPVRLLGMTLYDMDNEIPDGASEESFCVCNEAGDTPKLGMTAGAWMPARLIEVVRKPYCSPSLGGISFNNGVRLWGGHKEVEGDGSDKTFYNYHYWAYPLFMILDLFTQSFCNAGGFRNMDLMYMSELDPTWNIDELAFFTNPEAIVFANPLAVAACTVDCAVTTAYQPLKSLWWCAGCWGNLYPFVGNIASDGSPPRDSSLLSARVLAALHRRGLAHKTYGDDAMCGGTIYPMIPKQQYKLSMVFPIAEAKAEKEKAEKKDANGNTVMGANGQAEMIDKVIPGENCCHYIGESTFKWGEWRNIPGIGEDFVYLIWRYTDCCLIYSE
ncbi:MAG: TraU family protein [Methylicorpusculum sp.]|uniref:TraU family protein n=1 Tax=Methylicorpusculum sp. TaxID=2713644 RepID=UPI002721925F|nr:TraU family protein [Methylicorpusculum sp.]MDO8845329.1 TraU family protein [Methylicorpusculum sp.]MDO9238501.1 TraU family protein [Methylicorpusculum sp.]